jgi:hypothetical protein
VELQKVLKLSKPLHLLFVPPTFVEAFQKLDLFANFRSGKVVHALSLPTAAGNQEALLRGHGVKAHEAVRVRRHPIQLEADLLESLAVGIKRDSLFGGEPND